MLTTNQPSSGKNKLIQFRVTEDKSLFELSPVVYGISAGENTIAIVNAIKASTNNTINLTVESGKAYKVKYNEKAKCYSVESVSVKSNEVKLFVEARERAIEKMK